LTFLFGVQCMHTKVLVSFSCVIYILEAGDEDDDDEEDQDEDDEDEDEEDDEDDADNGPTMADLISGKYVSDV
jgi:hypothetical protein